MLTHRYFYQLDLIYNSLKKIIFYKIFQDKGGLIPLHNASSYGHIELAALLIKHSTQVNATDKWGFSPLHEAAQKGRTQLCALLVCEMNYL